MKSINKLMSCFNQKLQECITKEAKNNLESIYEIRLRVNKPLILVSGKKELLSNYIVTHEDIQSAVERMSNFSLYSFEEQLKNGFITMEGGHRIGISGKTVLEHGSVKTIRNIGSMNVRISHQIIGCSDNIIPYILENKMLLHTLIVSPPRCGKTTLLRDIIRAVSNGTSQIKAMTVAVVDERSEIAGSYMGVPQNDVGIRTDVLDCCPKAEGMLMLLRSMSPEVIALDEIGKNEDIKAIDEIINAGAIIICTIHGNSIQDLLEKPVFNDFINRKIIQRIIILSGKYGAGTIEAVYNKDLQPIPIKRKRDSG